MSKYLTGNKDLDMEIILNLRDDEIEPVCNVNKYVKDICESEIFWYRRIAKRIEYAKNENFKIVKDMDNVPIDGEGIKKMKEYFGFSKLKELNSYLNNFLEKALYFVYYLSTDENEKKELGYTIDEKFLPKYINKEELKYELRRQYAIVTYKPRNKNSIDKIAIDPIKGLYINNLKLKQSEFDEQKNMGIL